MGCFSATRSGVSLSEEKAGGGFEMRCTLTLYGVLLLVGTAGCAEKPHDGVVSTDVVLEAPVEVGEKHFENQLRGLFTYMADAALFEDCVTGHRYPVAMEAGYLELEHAYLEQRTEPGAPLLVTFEGRVEPRPPMEGDGEIDTMVIDRFEAVHPGEDCSGS